MDLCEYLRQDSNQNDDDYRTKTYAGLAVKILREMVPRLRMAKCYLKMLGKMHDYFSDVKTEFQERFPQKWTGGGLEQYKTLEKDLTEFGSLQDTDQDMASAGSDTVDQARSRESSNDTGIGCFNRDTIQGIEAALTPRPWTAINSIANENDDRKFTPNQGYQYNPNSQQPKNSDPPSLISRGESTLGINSPCAQNQPYLSSA